MVGEPGGFGALNQPLELLEVFAVQGFGGAKVGRHTVLHDAVLFENLIEHLQGLPAIDHEVL